MELRIYTRHELQALMLRYLITTTGRFKRIVYFGIMSVLRQVIYAVSWVLEGISLNTHAIATRYHVHNADGEFLRNLARDIALNIGQKGAKARGKIYLTARENSPGSFQVDPRVLSITIERDGAVYTYAPETQQPIVFAREPGASIATAVTWYAAVSIGSDSNFNPDRYPKIQPKLVTENLLVDSVRVCSDGFTGGHAEEYSDAEIREQIWDYYEGLGGGNPASIRFQARTIPGIVHASPVEDDPTPGESTLYLSDADGYAHPELIDAVRTHIEGDGTQNLGFRPLGIPMNYQAARRLSTTIVYSVAMKNGLAPKEYRELIHAGIRSGLDSSGFGLSLNPLTIEGWIKTVSQVDRMTGLNVYLFALQDEIPGIRILTGSLGAWNSPKILRYKPSVRMLSFDDGEYQPIVSGLMTLTGRDRSYVKLTVEPDMLPRWYRESEVTRVQFGINDRGYQLKQSEITRTYRIITDIEEVS